MMSRIRITLDPETQRRVRQRADDIGVSLAEYIRRLVVRDIGPSLPALHPSAVFDLGASGGSDISRHKEAMLRDAVASERRKPRLP